MNKKSNDWLLPLAIIPLAIIVVLVGIPLSVIFTSCTPKVKSSPVAPEVVPVPAPEPAPVPAPPKPCPCPGPCKPKAPKTIDPPSVKCSVVAFTASWCGPCQAAKPTLMDAIKAGIDVRIIDIDLEPVLARQNAISSVPTFLITENGVTTRTHDVGAVRRLIN